MLLDYAGSWRRFSGASSTSVVNYLCKNTHKVVLGPQMVPTWASTPPGPQPTRNDLPKASPASK
jgi:hypothetical protein